MPEPITTGFLVKAAASVAISYGLAKLSTWLRAPAENRLLGGFQSPSSIRRYFAFGRRAVPGHLAFAQSTDDDKVLHLVYVLSWGPCQQLEGLLVNGKRIPVMRRRAVGGELLEDQLHRADPLSGSIKVWAYMDAAANGGASLAGVPGFDRGAMRFDGWAWVHVRLEQKDFGDKGGKRYSGRPSLSFIVRGRPVDTPVDDREGWREDAASAIVEVLRYFEGYRDADFDIPTLQAAVDACRQTVTALEVTGAYHRQPGGNIWSPPPTSTAPQWLPPDSITYGDLARTGPAAEDYQARIGDLGFHENLEGQGKMLYITGPGTAPAGFVRNHIAHIFRDWNLEVEFTIGTRTFTFHGRDIEYEGIPSLSSSTVEVLPGEGLAAWSLTDEDYTAISGEYAAGRNLQVTVRRSQIRFPVGALVYFDQVKQLRGDFEFAMAGEIVEHRGKVYLEPGIAFSGAAHNIAPDDFAEVGSFTMYPQGPQRRNRVGFQLDQSMQDFWAGAGGDHRVPAFEAEDGGVVLPFRVSSRVVNDIYQMQQLAAVALSLVRLYRQGEYGLKPGERLQRQLWRPGDRINLVDPDRGIAGERFRIIECEPQKTGAIRIIVLEDPDSVYAAVDIAARQPQREIEGLEVSDSKLPPPENIRTSSVIDIGPGGYRQAYLIVEWDETKYPGLVRYRATFPGPVEDRPDGYVDLQWEYEGTLENRVRVPVVIGRWYEVEVVLLEYSTGNSSDWTA